MNKLVGSGVVLACIRPEHRLQYMEPMKSFFPMGGQILKQVPGPWKSL